MTCHPEKTGISIERTSKALALHKLIISQKLSHLHLDSGNLKKSKVVRIYTKTIKVDIFKSLRDK